MLVYLNGGIRRYDLNPIQVGRDARKFWEFQAVLRGRIGRLNAESPTQLHSSTLWLSPAGSSHGWTGEKGKSSEVAVFHFQHVPSVLETAASSRTGSMVPLSREQIARIRTLYHQALKHLRQPGPGLLLCSDQILSELSLIVYEGLISQQGNGFSTDWQRIQKALAWYESRLGENPGLKEIAAAVHVSPAHLRRLFHRCLQTSPHDAFDHLRYQRALQMLTDTNIKLAGISEACGFSEVAAFSRAFKNKFGAPPSSFRG